MSNLLQCLFHDPTKTSLPHGACFGSRAQPQKIRPAPPHPRSPPLLCRLQCGRCVCSQCSGNRVHLPALNMQSARVCNACFQISAPSYLQRKAHSVDAHTLGQPPLAAAHPSLSSASLPVPYYGPTRPRNASTSHPELGGDDFPEQLGLGLRPVVQRSADPVFKSEWRTPLIEHEVGYEEDSGCCSCFGRRD